MQTNEPCHFLKLKLQEYGARIPYIVSDLIQQLYAVQAYNVEGIFRLSGSSTKIDQCLEELDRGRDVDWSKYNDSAITLACVLKAYFRTLSETEPLLTFEKFNQFVSFCDIEDEATMLKSIKDACFELPVSHVRTLAFLMTFLHEIAANSEVNKMNAKNLAICFGPNILCPPPSDSSAALTKNAQTLKVVELIIQHAPEFFESIQNDQSAFMTDTDIEILRAGNQHNEIGDQILMRQTYRLKSVIPYVPSIYYESIRFQRPI